MAIGEFRRRLRGQNPKLIIGAGASAMAEQQSRILESRDSGDAIKERAMILEERL